MLRAFSSQSLAQIGLLLMLVGLVAVMLAVLLGRILALDIFKRMTAKQTYRIVKLAIKSTFWVAGLLIVLGFHVILAPAFVPPSGRLEQGVGSAPKDEVETKEVEAPDRTTQEITQQGRDEDCVEDNVSTSCVDDPERKRPTVSE